MKYTLDIEINLPIKEVVQKFDSIENMKHWQEGFVSFEPLKGTPGQVGSTAKLTYKMGKREVVIIETITHKDLPSEFHGTYEADGVFNVQRNFFKTISNNKTRWISESEFKFTSFMMKVFGLLMPGAFKKQSYKFMTNFKAFAENGTSVANA